MRNIPFSKEKKKRCSTIIFWKYRLKQMRNKQVLEEAFLKRKDIVEINNSYVNLIIHQAQQKLEIAQEKWNKLLTKGNKIREQELLNYYEVKIGNEILKEKAL